jgi:hypothetical protein
VGEGRRRGRRWSRGDHGNTRLDVERPGRLFSIYSLLSVKKVVFYKVWIKHWEYKS